MKRISVLFVVLALMLGLFAGCGTSGRYDNGSNVSTTDDGTVNGANPDRPGVMGGMDDGTMDHGSTAGTTNGPDGNGQIGGNR